MLSRQQLISPKNITKICRINSVSLDSSHLCGQKKTNPTCITKGYHEARGDIFCPSLIKGAYHLIQPRLNKGLAFTLKERQKLGITGLMPARIKTLEEQLYLLKLSVDRYHENLNKYLYLTDVHDRNETLFFRFLADNVEEMMPIVYTPTVGLACQKFGLIYRRPRGLFITIHDRGHVFDVLKSWPEPQVRAIVVTDGERILGLGDLGAYGIGIPVGKLALYTALAGIKPHQCLPILLDVGTNNEELLSDPLYVGLRQKRVTGKIYDDFIDEFMEAIVKRYDQNTLIQFEDFGNHNAFKMLDKYRDRYCTFNDDIQGTGAVVVGGLLASKRITGKLLKDNKFLFVGAGEASLGIANMCEKALQHEGLTIEEARSKIWMCDVDGLLTCDRDPKKLEGNKKNFAKNYRQMQNLEEITEELKPSILIGATAAAGIFTPKVLQSMANNNERPLIFALSNPTSKVECTAEDAYKYTEGRAIFSSGSPFGRVQYNGRTYTPGQGNNAYIFPGVALGIIASQTHHVSQCFSNFLDVSDPMFLIAAQVLADNVTDNDLNSGSLYPPLKCVREISMDIALQIIQYAYSNGYATVYPEPKDKRAWLQNQLFTFEYENHLPDTWEYPVQPAMQIRELSSLQKNVN